MESTIKTRGSSVGRQHSDSPSDRTSAANKVANTPSPGVAIPAEPALRTPPGATVAAPSERPVPARRRTGARDAFDILRFGFTVAPIAAGLDKFFHVLVNWDQYLSPLANRVTGGHGHGFMLLAGAIEVVAGIGIAWRPRIFGYVVAGWLGAIIVNLLTIPGYYDVALRDLGLALAALSLARLAGDFQEA